MADYVLGMNCKLYSGAAALDGDGVTAATSTWTEIDNVMDLTLDLSVAEADITTRGNSGWKATAPTLKEGTVTFDMLWDTADAGFAAIQDAWTDNAELAMAVMDGDIETSDQQGLASNFTVINFSRSEALGEATKVNVTLKPSSQTDWYTVA